jgi:hypothetical protein
VLRQTRALDGDGQDTGGVMFVADDLGAWLVALLADAGRKRLIRSLLGSEQDRALRQVATTAVQLAANELFPDSRGQAEDLALAVNEFFKAPLADEPLASSGTLLESMQAAIAGQLAVLGDRELTGTGQSAADVLGVPVDVLARVLTAHLLGQIALRGTQGGPLEPLAAQFNHDVTHLQGRRVEDMVRELTNEVREVLRERNGVGAVPTAPRDGSLGFRSTSDSKGVIEPPTTAITRASYITQILAIAPKKLMDRAEELDALAAFCSGEDAYQWWQGPPWAGKTALTAWFVLHPPNGTQIASFFITGRLDSNSDSDGFMLAMCQQLAMLASLPVPRDISRTAQKEILAYLLEAAARRIRDSGDRLILVVDGLDEDRAVRPGSSLMPIASLLPSRPPDGVHILVTSREHPPLPDDLASDHPLRTCLRRMLRVYAGASGMATSAKEEVRQRLQGGGQDRDIITLITTAGDGLTAAELAELTGRPASEIENQLDSVFGRSLRCWPLYGTTEQIYLFAHDTLRATAEKMLDADLRHCRDRFHDWAERYRVLGWPDTTPRYLFQPYARMLSTTRDTPHLAALAAEKARHDRMRKIMDSDTGGLAEIAAAQDLIVRDTPSDLTGLVLLAAEERRISSRNESVPRELPQVWARLGEIAYATDLARSIPDIDSRSYALAKVAAEICVSNPVQATDLAKEAEHALDPIYDSVSADTLAYIAKALAVAGEWGRAEVIARNIYDDARCRARALAEVAAAISASHPQLARRIASDADRTAHGMGHAPYRAHALAQVAAALASCYPNRAGRLAREAEEIVREFVPLRYRAEELANMSNVLVAGQPGRAARLAREAERCARSIADGFDKQRPLAAAARALAATGLYERAEDAAHELTDPEDEDYVLAQVAASLAAAGLRDRAEYLASTITSSAWHRANAFTAVADALTKSDPGNAARIANEALHAAWSDGNSQEEDLLLAHVAEALAAAGHLDRAESAAANIVDSSLRAKALSAIAAVLPDGHSEDTERFALSALFTVRDIIHPTSYELALQDISERFIAASLYDRAEEAARDIQGLSRRAMVLADIGIAIARSNPRDCGRIALEIQQMARHSDGQLEQQYILVSAIRAMSAAGLWEEAQHTASAITDSRNQAQATVAIAGAMATTGLLDEAENTALAINDPLYQAHALSVIAAVVAAASRGDASRIARSAWQIARDHANDESLGDTIIEVVKQLAAAGQWNSAEDIIRFIDSDYVRQKALVAFIESLARAGKWRQAKAVLTEIRSDTWQGKALIRVCTVIFDARALGPAKLDNEMPSLPRLLSQALLTKAWIGALVNLGRAAPSSVIALYDWTVPARSMSEEL